MNHRLRFLLLRTPILNRWGPNELIVKLTTTVVVSVVSERMEGRGIKQGTRCVA